MAWVLPLLPTGSAQSFPSVSYTHLDVYKRQMLDCSRISINGGWFSLDEDPSKAWDNMVSSIGLICDIAGEQGIDVCLETLTPKRYRLLTDRGSMAQALSDIDRPNLQVTLDTGTIARGGEDLEDYLEQFETKIGYVHLTNLDPSVFAHLAWGDEHGILDAARIVNSLIDVYKRQPQTPRRCWRGSTGPCGNRK